jgi:tetratricopeptide (TPR) repeat protein
VAPGGHSVVVGLGPGGVLRADRPPDAVAPRSELDPADPDSPVVLADLGDRAQTAEEREAAYLQARSRLDRLAAAFPGEPGYPREQARVLAGLGDVWLAVGRLEEAEQAWRGAIDVRERLARDHPNQPGIRPALAAAHFGLGQVLQARGLRDDAEASYRRIIGALKDDRGQRLNTWAWQLATHPDPRRQHARAAVVLASKAVEISPEEGTYWNTLGVAHYRAGEWKDAAVALEKAMSLRAGGDAFDWFFLAMTHHRRGDRGKAREWFDRAVAWADQQKGLGRPQLAQLKQFSAEAEQVLAGQ